MANDWIKMRTWLCKDTRVIGMADYLASERAFMNWLTDPVQVSCKETAYEHVTRNVTVALCVTGLLVTWGTAREQGDRVDDDLVLPFGDKYSIDAITGIECFGDAMEHVGWLTECEDGSLIFPKFFKENESPEEKHKRQNAERQRKHREKQLLKNNVTVTHDSNVTVTHRGEERIEEKSKEEVWKEPHATSLQIVLKHFEKTDFSKEEVETVWRSYEASKINGKWKWGKGFVTDWRNAMHSRLSDRRMDRDAKRPADTPKPKDPVYKSAEEQRAEEVAMKIRFRQEAECKL